MKSIRFSGFMVHVPEEISERYGYSGNVGKKVKDLVKTLNEKNVVLSAICVANMVKQEIHQNYTEIV